MEKQTELRNRSLMPSRKHATAAVAAALLLPPTTFLVTLALVFTAPARAETPPPAIPFSDIGAKAMTDHQGDGLAVISTANGARLRCVFQRLEGEATGEGLWLTSTVTNAVSDRFRVVATVVERAETFGVRRQSAAATPLPEDRRINQATIISESGVALRFPPQSKMLRLLAVCPLTASSCALPDRGW